MAASASKLTKVSGPGPVLGWRPFLAIVCAFWAYAALSAILYAYGMDVSFRNEIGKSLFADWPLRLLLYVVLLMPLIACYRSSLWIGWRPLAPRALAQLGLAVSFALLPWPLFMVILHYLEPVPGVDDATIGDVLEKLRADLPMWLASFTEFLVRYGFGLALVSGFAVYKRYRDTEMRIAALEQQWGEARLAALRMQLSPHTLFNLLHTIRGHIAWDPAVAQSMVIHLADLLRRLLNAGERDFGLLADELQFARLYLDLQRQRFVDRLTAKLPESDTLPACWVPSLILQPLIENAVVHGLAGHDGAVTVIVELAVQDQTLIMGVRNTLGPGTVARAEGIGLRNVRERLAVQFGPEARFEAGPVDGGGWIAEIRMPLLLEPPPTARP